MSPALAAAFAEPWMIDPATWAVIRQVADRGEVPAELLEAMRRGEPAAVSARPGRPLDESRGRTTVRDRVATIPVRGPIVRHGGLLSDVCGTATVAGVAHDLRAAVESPAVRAVVLEFDSPGGQVTGIGELARMIFESRGKKPLAAYVDGSACSAAYYLAAACDEVVVAAMGRVGSIGCMMAVPPKDPRAAAGVEFVSSQSPLKNPDPASEAGRSEYQAMVDDLATIFVEDVAEFRGTSPETVERDFGRGGTRVGKAAVAAGMADRVGSYESLHRELSAF